jgi:hypothetical protein
MPWWFQLKSSLEHLRLARLQWLALSLAPYADVTGNQTVLSRTKM